MQRARGRDPVHSQQGRFSWLAGSLIRYAAPHRFPVYALHPSTCMRSEPVNGGPQARVISP